LPYFVPVYVLCTHGGVRGRLYLTYIPNNKIKDYFSQNFKILVVYYSSSLTSLFNIKHIWYVIVLLQNVYFITIFREVQSFMHLDETLRYMPERRGFDSRWGH